MFQKLPQLDHRLLLRLADALARHPHIIGDRSERFALPSAAKNVSVSGLAQTLKSPSYPSPGGGDPLLLFTLFLGCIVGLGHKRLNQVSTPSRQAPRMKQPQDRITVLQTPTETFLRNGSHPERLFASDTPDFTAHATTDVRAPRFGSHRFSDSATA